MYHQLLLSVLETGRTAESRSRLNRESSCTNAAGSKCILDEYGDLELWLKAKLRYKRRNYNNICGVDL